MWIWCSCLDCRDPGDARNSGKLEAMGMGDTDMRYGSPPSRILVNLCVCLGYVGLVYVVFTPFRLPQISCFTPDSLKCLLSQSQPIALMWGSHPCFSSRAPRCKSVLLTLFFFLSSLHPTEFCVDRYIPFCWLRASSWVMWSH